MGNQAKVSVERNGSGESESKGIVHEVTEFTEGVVTLVELQGQLLAVDIKECCQRSFLPGLVLVGGFAMGLACFPVALTAVALMLVDAWELSPAVGFLISAAAGAIFSLLLCTLGWLLIRRHLSILRRSQQELVCNINWIRSTLERNRIKRNNCQDRSSRRM